MNKELEEDKKQINKMLDNIYDGLEFEDDEEIRELYLKQKHALKTALNYIENSIPKETIIEKLDNLELSEELQESWNELDGSTAVTLAYKELLRNK